MLHDPSIAPFPQPFPWLMENIVREMIVYIFIKHKRISIVVNLIGAVQVPLILLLFKIFYRIF